MSTTTFYHAICNGYDKPGKMPGMCPHTDYTVIAGSCNPDRATLWNRYHKILGATKLSEFTVYMDGNITPKRPLCEMHHWIEEVMKDSDLAICKHAARKCAYVEVEACLGRGKINKKQAAEAHEYLTSIDFPKNFGLWECGIIIRRTSVPWVEKLCAKWMDLIVQTDVVRDQIWLPVALKQSTFPAGRFLTMAMNVRDNSLFTFKKHA